MSKNSIVSDVQLLKKEKIQTAYPPKFQITLYNDHYTSTQFVVEVLISVFLKSTEEANKKMMEVHKKGKSVVGIYTREIAETKVIRVEEMAKKNNFPLKVTMEEIS